MEFSKWKNIFIVLIAIAVLASGAAFALENKKLLETIYLVKDYKPNKDK